jgi:hypothetical protein
MTREFVQKMKRGRPALEEGALVHDGAKKSNSSRKNAKSTGKKGSN